MPRNFISSTILVTEAIRALRNDYLVYHDRSIKIGELIKVQPITVPRKHSAKIFQIFKTVSGKLYHIFSYEVNDWK